MTIVQLILIFCTPICLDDMQANACREQVGITAGENEPSQVDNTGLPYPQVPLGWRKVTLEWDEGWWFLDFNSK